MLILGLFIAQTDNNRPRRYLRCLKSRHCGFRIHVWFVALCETRW